MIEVVEILVGALDSSEGGKAEATAVVQRLAALSRDLITEGIDSTYLLFLKKTVRQLDLISKDDKGSNVQRLMDFLNSVDNLDAATASPTYTRQQGAAPPVSAAATASAAVGQGATRSEIAELLAAHVNILQSQGQGAGSGAPSPLTVRTVRTLPEKGQHMDLDRVLRECRNAFGGVVPHSTFRNPARADGEWGVACAFCSSRTKPPTEEYTWSEYREKFATVRTEAGVLTESDARRLDILVKRAQREVLAEVRLVCCTCANCSKPMFNAWRVELAILDEASQASVADAAVVLAMAPARLVLIGDTKQLGPVVKDESAKRAGLGVSMMERAVSHGCPCVVLVQQYRMPVTVAAFPSEAFYEGKLITRRAGDASGGAAFPWQGELRTALVQCPTASQESKARRHFRSFPHDGEGSVHEAPTDGGARPTGFEYLSHPATSSAVTVELTTRAGRGTVKLDLNVSSQPYAPPAYSPCDLPPPRPPGNDLSDRFPQGARVEIKWVSRDERKREMWWPGVVINSRIYKPRKPGKLQDRSITVKYDDERYEELYEHHLAEWTVRSAPAKRPPRVVQAGRPDLTDEPMCTTPFVEDGVPSRTKLRCGTPGCQREAYHQGLCGKECVPCVKEDCPPSPPPSPPGELVDDSYVSATPMEVDQMNVNELPWQPRICAIVHRDGGHPEWVRTNPSRACRSAVQ